MLNNNNYIDDEFNEYVEYEADIFLRDHVIYEISDSTPDDSVVISPCNSKYTSDCMSEKTCSSLENEFETIFNDYSIIIDCLSSTRFQRSQSDIAGLSQLLQSIPDFMYINAAELEYVCQAAKLFTIDFANQIIVRKCSVLSEWYLCLQGCIRQEGASIQFFGPGSCIGTDLWSKETLISDYDLFSHCDNCKLMVIGVADLEPMDQLNNLIIKTSDEDKSVIAVYEAYTNVANGDEKCSYVLTKGTTKVLISHLFSSPKWVSEDYVEDFFLTRKLFLQSTKDIRHEIIDSLYSDTECTKVKFKVLIRWISQNFSDFEKDPRKLSFLDEVTGILKKQNNDDLLYNLYECCSNCALIRDIKETISLKDYVVPVYVSSRQTVFYVTQINDPSLRLRNGDIIVELEGRTNNSITIEVIKSLSEEHAPISMAVKNDLLGYHEHVLKDIKPDSVSVHSTPSTSTLYSRCSSDQSGDKARMSTISSDSSFVVHRDKNSHTQKRPEILPNFFSTLQTGTIGKFFKNPKHYAKSAIQNGSRSNSDMEKRLENLQTAHRDLVGSSISVARFSRRMKSKRRPRSIGSDGDLIKSFEDLNIDGTDLHIDNKYPIKINIRDTLICPVSTSNTKFNRRHFYLLIEPNTTVTEVIVCTLLKLNLSSAKSSQFFLVEIKVDETSGMIHQKILRPETANLIVRLNEHTRYYLKHESVFGESILLQSEADRMLKEFRSPNILELSINALVVRMFLNSHRLLCQIQASELTSHVTSGKATLKLHREAKTVECRLSEYMHLSDYYKYWVITEICAEESTVCTRAEVIQYFINLALKAMFIGHIDLFFSIISGLESIEVIRLNLSWEKVSKRNKKILRHLKTTLDVSGNMRNLRIVHQRQSSPLIPVTAMVIKDLTMLEETHPTYVIGTINGLPVNSNLLNFDKMRKMSKLARSFTNSCCSCGKDRSRPVLTHSRICYRKRENWKKLEKFLQQRLESQSDLHSPKLSSQSGGVRPNRKYSFSNSSVQSSSTESLSESASSLKSVEDKSNQQMFEQRMMMMKIDRYLKTLDTRVIADESKLSEMSFSCEQNSHNEGIFETKLRNSSKIHKSKENGYTSSKLSSSHDNEKSRKAAEFAE